MASSVTEELQEEEETEINLTPMLDVVFIMLIFFIVTAVFVREPGIDVDRPQAVTIAQQDAAMFVAISAQNEIWIDGDEVELAGVRIAIERLMQSNPESGLIIQSDSAARNQYLIAVMDAAKAAGVSDIILAAGPQ
jgi:biopolymer transport protein ExbD